MRTGVWVSWCPCAPCGNEKLLGLRVLVCVCKKVRCVSELSSVGPDATPRLPLQPGAGCGFYFAVLPRSTTDTSEYEMLR